MFFLFLIFPNTFKIVIIFSYFFIFIFISQSSWSNFPPKKKSFLSCYKNFGKINENILNYKFQNS